MALSNTATPKYYEQFRQAVLDGEQPVNYEVSLEMNRIDALIANPGVYYDDQAVEGWIAFCNNELTLVDGSDLNLLPMFKVWGEQVYGWYYYIDRQVYNPEIKAYEMRRVKQRLVRKQFLVVPRGAAKSMYESSQQSFHIGVNPMTTHQVTCAPTMKQAEEVMSPIRTAITRARGPLFKFLTAGSIRNTSGAKHLRPKLVPTKKGIENFLTNSLLEIRPMTIDKLQGLRVFIATVDEWLSGDVREDVIGALEQGASKMDDYLILAVSSEGTVRNSVGDEIKMELMNILTGKYYNPHVSIWIHKLDDVSEVANPEMWKKCQPNIGKTVTWETYQQEVERAEQVPAARNDILAKRFGIPTEGYTYFFTYEETLPHPYREFFNCSCALGGDMSQGDDFCAFTFLFDLSVGYHAVKNRCYISERTMNKLPTMLRQKYEQFVQEGSLVVLTGDTIDLDIVYEDIVQYIDGHNLDVRCFGYDYAYARVFAERWARERSEYGMLKVRQGFLTESVPLGNIKKLAEDRHFIFDQSIMSFCMGNAVVLEDTNGNRKLWKKRALYKVDCVASAMDAYIARTTFPHLFE